MRLSRIAYYADFAVYPTLIGVMILVIAHNSHLRHGAFALGLGLAGALLWTLLEYVMHRFLLHGGSRIAGLHDAHHAQARAWIGTPTWLSVTAIAGMALPTLLFGAPVFIYLSLTVGLMAGFLLYGLIHHAIHHGEPRILARTLSRSARRHFEHHRRGGVGNFGVTTEFWDRLLGTRLPPRAAGAPRRQPVKGAST